MLRETSPSVGALGTDAGVVETADEAPLPPQAASRPAAPAAPAALRKLRRVIMVVRMVLSSLFLVCMGSRLR